MPKPPKKPTPPEERSPLARWIKESRERLGLSQDDAAAKIDVDRSTLADWERDDATPRYANIQKLRGLFGSEGPNAPGMSDPASKVDSTDSLEAFLALRAEDLSPRDVKFLRELAPRQLAGLVPDTAYYDGVLLAFRELQRRQAARKG